MVQEGLDLEFGEQYFLNQFGPSVSDPSLSTSQKLLNRGIMNNFISKQDCVPGKAYFVKARNFKYAIWDGEKFHGLRDKFGSKFIDIEYHWHDGAPHGTVKPLVEFNVDERAELIKLANGE